MSEEVAKFFNETCKDFTAMDGIFVDNFNDIDEFKEIGAGAFACVYKARKEVSEHCGSRAYEPASEAS